MTKGVSGTTPAVFTVTLSTPSALVTTVHYATADGSAVANVGYLPVSGIVTFNPGATSELISVPVLGNHVLTGTQTFFVNLSQPVNATIVQSQAMATILDINSLVVTTTADDGPGSLRWAILTANATPGVNTITFQIPGGGAQTINVMSPLPTITHVVDINATTQPGYFGTPLVTLNGAAAGSGTNGLMISAGNSTVRGLAINLFGGSGLFLEGAGGDTAQGNYFGISTDGKTGAGNRYYGVLIFNSANNLIGGSGPGAQNVISGNLMGGVYLGFEQAYGNLISGNLIGTNAAGNRPVGNEMNGIFVDYAPSNRFTDNVVSSNFTNGIKLYGPDSINEVLLRNIIGLSAQGNLALPNGGKGLYVNPSTNKRYAFPTSGRNRNVVFNLGSHFHAVSTGQSDPSPRGARHRLVTLKSKHGR